MQSQGQSIRAIYCFVFHHLPTICWVRFLSDVSVIIATVPIIHSKSGSRSCHFNVFWKLMAFLIVYPSLKLYLSLELADCGLCPLSIHRNWRELWDSELVSLLSDEATNQWCSYFSLFPNDTAVLQILANGLPLVFLSCGSLSQPLSPHPQFEKQTTRAFMWAG